MNARMQAAILPGGRLHLQDGPIDLVIGADGERDGIRRAFASASLRFATVLDELCGELALLREEMRPGSPLPGGRVAQRMDRAVRALCGERFITRMAAVAGSVADEILEAMCAAAPLRRAYVNNGGDIAIHLSPGTRFDVGMVGAMLDAGRDIPPPPLRGRVGEGGSEGDGRSPPLPGPSGRPSPQGGGFAPALTGTASIVASDPIRGIATSGRGGRSFSLGIADAVTILAADAAMADAAATLVANAVDLPGHAAITRKPAREFDPQSDLGDRLVTRDVGPLSHDEVDAALAGGVREARRLRDQGFLVAAALTLCGETRIVGDIGLSASLPGKPKNIALRSRC